MSAIVRREYTAVLLAVLLSFTVGMAVVSHLSFSNVSSLSGIDSENGLLESLQQLLIGLSGFGFLASFVWSHPTLPKERSLILVAVCITFLLRETDVPVADRTHWLAFWLDESGKKLILVVTWLPVIGFVFADQSMRTRVTANLTVDRTLVLLVAGALSLLIGWTLDREYVTVRNGVFFEELFELIGYGFVLVASLIWNRSTFRVATLEATIRVPSFSDGSLSHDTLSDDDDKSNQSRPKGAA